MGWLVAIAAVWLVSIVMFMVYVARVYIEHKRVMKRYERSGDESD